jgi:hypothetical protein
MRGILPDGAQPSGSAARVQTARAMLAEVQLRIHARYVGALQVKVNPQRAVAMAVDRDVTRIAPMNGVRRSLGAALL